MKYIPTHNFLIKKRVLSGSVKNYFTPGKTYTIYNIKNLDNEVIYTFRDNSAIFELKFPTYKAAEEMIDYLSN